MPLPLITTNMYFDVVLRAVEAVLKAESANQIALGGVGWRTVRERFDPWQAVEDEFKPGLVNVTWNQSTFDAGKSSNHESSSDSQFVVDCYASDVGLDSGGVITPKDQRAADVLHSLITKVYYTLSSTINFDMGLTPGTITKPFITDVQKFIPTKNNTPLRGIIAARVSLRVEFVEQPPESQGVPLEVVNLKSYNENSDILTEQTFEI